MKTFLAILILFVSLAAFGQETKSAAGASQYDAGIVSYGNARASDFVGVKTKVSLLPVTGFGNVINTNDGSISTSTNYDWTYTKRVITETWTTNWSLYYGRTMKAKQDELLAYWGLDSADPSCDATIWDGFNNIPLIGQYTATNILCGGFYQDITKCVYDRSSETNYVSGPTATNGGGTYQSYSQYFQSWRTNGLLLVTSNANSTTGPTVPSFITSAFTFTDSTNENAWNGVTNISYWNRSTNVSGGTWTYTYNGRADSTIGQQGYPVVQVCSSGDGNMTYGTLTATYTKTITYSDPISRSDIAAQTEGLLANINLHVKGERYYCFDRTNTYPVQLTWNPIYFPQSIRLDLNIMRGESPTVYDTTIVNSFIMPPFTAEHTNWPTAIDTSATINKTYYYRIMVRHSAPGAAFTMEWYATNSVSTLTPAYPILPPLELVERTLQTTNSITNTPLALNFKATNMWLQLNFDNSVASFATRATNDNPNNAIGVFPISTNHTQFVLSTNINLARPFFLAAKGQLYGLNFVRFPVISGANVNGSYYSASSLAYLPKNNPSNTPPSSNWVSQFFFTNYNHTAGQILTNFVVGFPRGVLRTNNTPYLISRWVDILPTHCPTNGWIMYR